MDASGTREPYNFVKTVCILYPYRFFYVKIHKRFCVEGILHVNHRLIYC